MLMRAFDWCFRDRGSGRIVIAQWPNLWLWVFGAASVVEVAVGSQGLIGIASRVTATLFLVIWAGDEVLRGVNPWRRSLGGAVLIWLAVRLFV